MAEEENSSKDSGGEKASPESKRYKHASNDKSKPKEGGSSSGGEKAKPGEKGGVMDAQAAPSSPLMGLNEQFTEDRADLAARQVKERAALAATQENDIARKGMSDELLRLHRNQRLDMHNRQQREVADMFLTHERAYDDALAVHGKGLHTGDGMTGDTGAPAPAPKDKGGEAPAGEGEAQPPLPGMPGKV